MTVWQGPKTPLNLAAPRISLHPETRKKTIFTDCVLRVSIVAFRVKVIAFKRCGRPKIVPKIKKLCTFQ